MSSWYSQFRRIIALTGCIVFFVHDELKFKVGVEVGSIIYEFVCVWKYSISCVLWVVFSSFLFLIFQFTLWLDIFHE